MKTIGIIGASNPETVAEFCRRLHEAVRAEQGAAHSAPLVLAAPDFAGVEHGQGRGVAAVLVETGQALERAGADFVALVGDAAVQGHAAALEEGLSIPLLAFPGDMKAQVAEAAAVVLEHRDLAVNEASLARKRARARRMFALKMLALQAGLVGFAVALYFVLRGIVAG